MANEANGNTWKVDTSSTSGTASTFLKKRQTRVLGIVVHADANTDTVKIYDLNKTAYDSSPTYALGDLKFDWVFEVAARKEYFDFAKSPVIFPNGIWVALTGSPILTFILDVA